MKDSIGTETDLTAHEWAITDRVIQLRRWGSDVIYPLPQSPNEEPILGSAETCALRLNDPSGQLSRRHARLIWRKTGGWKVLDLGSKNGLQLDGAYRREGDLDPGTELGIGRIVLVAESEQFIALRSFLSRLLGWGEALTPEIDRALRSVRLAVTRRAPLVLSGDGDLPPIAHALHTRVLGPDRPFVLCDPRRRGSNGSVRSVANRDEIGVALRTARGGTLCVWRHRLPSDASELFNEIRNPKSCVQLIICARKDGQKQIERFLATPIVIPSLAKRAQDMELDRIIIEYANNAMAELNVVQPIFTDEDCDWVRTFSASSLSDIEKGTRRLVAFRTSPSVAVAAGRLGMAQVSLSRWLGRRSLPKIKKRAAPGAGSRQRQRLESH